MVATLAGLLVGAMVTFEAFQDRLTLAEAAARALSYYPSVQASMADVDVAESAMDEAEAARFPTLDVGGGVDHFGDPMIVFPIHAFNLDLLPPFDRNLWQAQAELRYVLYDGGGRSARIEESRARRESARTSLVEARQALLSHLIQQYLAILSLSRTLDAQDRSLQALAAELSRVRQVFDVGRAATVDVLRVEASIAAARAERVRLASSLDLAQRNLARFLGTDVSESRAANLVPVALADVSLPAREEILRGALEASPMAQKAREELAVAEAAVEGSRGRQFPSILLDGRTINYGSFSGENSFEWNVGVSVAYSLFSGGTVSSAVARSVSAARSASERARWMELEVAGEVDRGLSAVEEADARIESLVTAVARFDEVSRIEKLRLDTGVGIEADYVRAEADRLAAEADLIEARYAEVAARAELARVAGSLSPEWIEQNLRNEP
ncbi:MAG TPA: TolC family protein [Vicinamibacteria bacterium]|nr:TolC family protein [Vicinamibacteria bacterium]